MPAISKNYFAPSDIDMVARVLDRAGIMDQAAPDNANRLSAARLLLSAFQNGITAEEDLFDALDNFDAVAPPPGPRAMRPDPLNFIETEGGFRYGRRVEANGTWTIYHVFSGVPATYGQWHMVDLGVKTAERALKILNQPIKKRP